MGLLIGSKKFIVPGLLMPLLITWLVWIYPTRAQTPQAVPPPARIERDEGGPVQVTGQGSYTNPNLPLTTPLPAVVLLDQGQLYVQRGSAYSTPLASQVFGRLLTPFSASPFSYTLNLPAAPQGQLFDVDQDPQVDSGVQIWTIGVYNDSLSEPLPLTLSPLEQQLGPALLSVQRSQPALPQAIAEPDAGTLLVYAPEAGAGFPAAFGADGQIFTQDDPIVALPAGWTLVVLGLQDFTFDRSRVANMPLLEPPAEAPLDLSKLDFVSGFNAFIDLMQARYAYTDFRQVDWEAWRSEFLPQVEAASAAQDDRAYYQIYREIAQRLKDGSVSLQLAGPLVGPASLALSRPVSIGLQGPTSPTYPRGTVQLEDGRVLVTAVMPDSRADQFGLKPLAEIMQVNNRPVNEWLQQVAEESWLGTPAARLDAALRFQFNPGEVITLTFRNPGQEPQTRSFTNPPLNPDSDPAMLYSEAGFAPRAAGPEPLGLMQGRLYTTRSGRQFGYLSWPAFSGGDKIIPAFETFLAELKDKPGLVLDLRGNRGGSSALLLTMLGYFFPADKPLTLERYLSRRYDPTLAQWLESGPFDFPPGAPLHAPSPALYYPGQVVILVDSRCTGACEYFALWLQEAGRAAVMGLEGTAGASGDVRPVSLPAGSDGLSGGNFTFPVSQDVYRDTLQPYLAGKGVEPDVPVPVDEAAAQALAAGADPVLESALAWLEAQLPPAGPSAAITGTVTYRERIILPEAAVVRVRLVNLVPPQIIAQQIITPAGQAPPFPFELTYDPAQINQAAAYNVQAAVLFNGQRLFESSQPYLVITHNRPLTAQVVLEQVGELPPPAVEPTPTPTPTPLPPPPAIITGTVTYREQIALPPQAVVTVQLLDISKTDVPAPVIAEQTINLQGQPPPFPFSLSFDPAGVNQSGIYAVQARIEVDGKLWFTTTSAALVLTQGQPTTVELTLDPVAQNAPANPCQSVEVLRAEGQPADRSEYLAYGDESGLTLNILGAVVTINPDEPGVEQKLRDILLESLGYCSGAYTPERMSLYLLSPDQVSATVFTGLVGDDSVAAQEVRIDLFRQEGNQWRVDWAGVRFLCARGDNTSQLTREFCP